jgi:hypothetical protein
MRNGLRVEDRIEVLGSDDKRSQRQGGERQGKGWLNVKRFRMKRELKHGIRLVVMADRDQPVDIVLQRLVEMLEDAIRWAEHYITENRQPHYWGGNGRGQETTAGRRRYLFYVGVQQDAVMRPEDMATADEWLEALRPALVVARRIREAGGDLEEVRAAMRKRSR